MMIFTMILQIITTTLMAIHGEAKPPPKCISHLCVGSCVISQ